MKKLMLLFAFFSILGMQIYAQKTVTGTVTDNTGETIPGVTVSVKGTTLTTATDVNGTYSIEVPDGSTVLVFEYIGSETQEVTISGDVVNVTMAPSSQQVDEVVVTALGIERKEKTLTYASQNVGSKELNISSNTNIKDAITGKVAGVQMLGQAGSKLGQSGRIRIRGAVSLTSDADPLYIVDGIPVSDPNVIDMENIESVNVLKGPNATALYGQRAEYGVVMITTKKASKKNGVFVEFNSNVTFDKVAYLPNYQDLYGAGYDGEDEWATLDYDAGAWGVFPYAPEFEVFDGKQWIWDGYADESWGPAFDGREYVAWYNIWPESPYYGQTATWDPQPDNIENFYDLGTTFKNTVAVSGAGDKFNARVAFTNLNQDGIMPYSTLDKNMINTNFTFNPIEKLSISLIANYSQQEVSGDFDDSYANQTTGSFNNWFNRNLDMDIMKELKDLKTTHGYHASWNYWGFDLGTYFGTENGAFWYNPYFWLENYVNITNEDRLLGKLSATYDINKKFSVTGSASTNYYTYKNHYELPYTISHSSDPQLYNTWNNGFGNKDITMVENNYEGLISYKDKFGDFDVDANVGASIRQNSYDEFKAQMEIQSKTQGLTLPDVYTYSNAILPVTPSTYEWDKTVESIYGRVSVGYKNMAYLDATLRRDWSSALPADRNGYSYPSVGASFIFTELIADKSILSFGKIRAGYAQVGSDMGALEFNPVYPLSSNSYNGLPQMYTQSVLIDPDIVVPYNTSIEAGIDLKFLKDRIGFSATYFDEVREDEIVDVTLSTTTGYTAYKTNAGSSERTGVELTLNATPVKKENIVWEVFFNFGTSNPEITELPGDLEEMDAPGGHDDWGFVYMTQELDNAWGQLRGRSIARDDNGNYIINSATGMYDYESGTYFGSVIPDFTGGILNSVTLFNLVNISASIDFQSGGKFFSLSEMWGDYSGLLEETAQMNDRGHNIRDDVADGGGVHVVGVDETGAVFDDYIPAQDYYKQFQSNYIAEPYIHDASYVKLRDVSVSVNLPKKWFASNFVNSATIGFIGRNLWLISVAEDNVHGWDPSELSQTYGENAQLPGTKSYGFNIKLTF